MFQKCDDIDSTLFLLKKEKKRLGYTFNKNTTRKQRMWGKKTAYCLFWEENILFQSVQKSKTLYGWGDNKNSLCTWKHTFQNWTHARENGIVGNVGLEMRTVHSCQGDIVSPKLHAPPAKAPGSRMLIEPEEKSVLSQPSCGFI